MGMSPLLEYGSVRRRSRTRVVVAGLALLGVLLVGAGGASLLRFRRPVGPPFFPGAFPLARTDDDPPGRAVANADVITCEDFVFAMGEGSGWSGYDTIRLTADGECRYTFAGPVTARADPVHGKVYEQKWLRAEFQVDLATVGTLRQLLVNIGYFRMKRAYHADVHDGTQWVVRVDAGGRVKGVYCNNFFPAEIKRLPTFVHVYILGPHQADLDAATPIDLDPMEQWKQLEDAP